MKEVPKLMPSHNSLHTHAHRHTTAASASAERKGRVRHQKRVSGMFLLSDDVMMSEKTNVQKDVGLNFASLSDSCTSA